MSGSSTTNNEVRREKAKRGCAFWAVAAFIVVLVSVGGASWVSFYLVTTHLEEFSSAEQVSLPLEGTALSSADLDRLYPSATVKVQKLSSLGENKDRASETVSMSVDELNALLQRAPELASEKFSERIFLRPAPKPSADGSFDLLADVCLPLDEIEDVSRFEGRWLNGTFRMQVGYHEGTIQLRVAEGLSPDGKAISDLALRLASEVATRNVNQGLADELAEVTDFRFDGKAFLLTTRAKKAVPDPAKSGDEVEGGDPPETGKEGTK